MDPEVVYLIVCDAVEADPLNFHRLPIRGLLTRIWSDAKPPFPITRPEFCVFVMFAAGQADVRVALRVVTGATGHNIFRTVPRRFRFTGQRSDLTAATF